jgi:hypothetical protein
MARDKFPDTEKLPNRLPALVNRSAQPKSDQALALQLPCLANRESALPNREFLCCKPKADPGIAALSGN